MRNRTCRDMNLRPLIRFRFYDMRINVTNRANQHSRAPSDGFAACAILGCAIERSPHTRTPIPYYDQISTDFSQKETLVPDKTINDGRETYFLRNFFGNFFVTFLRIFINGESDFCISS